MDIYFDDALFLSAVKGGPPFNKGGAGSSGDYPWGCHAKIQFTIDKKKGLLKKTSKRLLKLASLISAEGCANKGLHTGYITLILEKILSEAVMKENQYEIQPQKGKSMILVKFTIEAYSIFDILSYERPDSIVTSRRSLIVQPRLSERSFMRLDYQFSFAHEKLTQNQVLYFNSIRLQTIEKPLSSDYDAYKNFVFFNLMNNNYDHDQILTRLTAHTLQELQKAQMHHALGSEANGKPSKWVTLRDLLKKEK